jgi:hypothetical protein
LSGGLDHSPLAGKPQTLFILNYYAIAKRKFELNAHCRIIDRDGITTRGPNTPSKRKE